MPDMINHPHHYQTDSGLEAIDVIEHFFPTDAHLSHVFKYMARVEKKDTPESNVRKAIWWLVRKLSCITGKRFLHLTEYTPLPTPVILEKGVPDGDVVDIFGDSIRVRMYQGGELRNTVFLPLDRAKTVAVDILSRLEDAK